MILRTLTELDQDAAGGLGMQKGNPGAAGSDPRGLIDELDIFFLEFFKRRIDIGDPKGDVLEAGALLFNEFGHGTVGGALSLAFHF